MKSHRYSPIPIVFAPKPSEALMSDHDRQLQFGSWTVPLQLRYFIFLPFVYLLGGVFLPSLWRGVDANTFSVLMGIGGDLDFQGEVFRQSVATSPAYYRLLDFGTRLMGGLIGEPSAMRFSQVCIIMTGLIALYRAIRQSFTAELATVSVLITATCLGGLEFMHVVGAKAGAFTAICIALWGLTQSFTRTLGGVILGLGWVLSVMMGSGTVMTTLIPALLLLVIRRDRNPHVFSASMLLAISMMGVTLISLFMFTGRSATEINLWLPDYRFTSLGDMADALIRLTWFTFPLWPIVFAYRYYWRKQWNAQSRSWLFIAMVGGCVALPLALAGADGAMMLLPFLGMLFGPGLMLLGTHWLRAWHWFNFLLFSLLMLPVIMARILWSQDAVPLISNKLHAIFPDFNASLSIPTLLLVVLLVLAWGYWMLESKRHVSWRFRPALGWVAGMIALWWITIILWLPALDHTKSYASMIREVPLKINDIMARENQIIPSRHTIIATPRRNCLDVSLAPFAFQVNWRFRFPLQDREMGDCRFRLITLGKAERQSLLLSDSALAQEENETLATMHGNDTTTLAPTDSMPSSVTSPGAESPPPPRIQRGRRQATSAWVTVQWFQRPGDTRENVALQQWQ
jgi:hypothetical protein